MSLLNRWSCWKRKNHRLPNILIYVIRGCGLVLLKYNHVVFELYLRFVVFVQNLSILDKPITYYNLIILSSKMWTTAIL